MKKEEVTNDLVYFDNLKIIQNKKYFNFSLDSVLLPDFVKVNKNTHNILDLCTGNAPIPIILSTKTDAKIVGVELQKDIYDLAVKSVNINNLNNQIEIINDDIKNVYDRYESDTFDIITCNPPYFKCSVNSLKNEEFIKSAARHEIYMNLEDIFRISKKLLKNGGNLYLVHRTERLIEIMLLMKKYNIEPKIIKFIYPKMNSESSMMLICGKKNGKSGLKIEKLTYVHNEDGSYSDEVLKIFSKKGGKNDTEKL